MARFIPINEINVVNPYKLKRSLLAQKILALRSRIIRKNQLRFDFTLKKIEETINQRVSKMELEVCRFLESSREMVLSKAKQVAILALGACIPELARELPEVFRKKIQSMIDQIMSTSTVQVDAVYSTEDGFSMSLANGGVKITYSIQEEIKEIIERMKVI